MKKSTKQKFTQIKKQDKTLYDLLQKEQQRQLETLELIPSENIVSKAVLEALGSVLTNKYAEGYPNARYYGGNEIIDKIENLAIERAKKLFNVPYANVQPYSGSPANLAVYLATCEPGDTIMGQMLFDGGHLTHGWKANISSKFFNSISYHVKEDGFLDLKEIEKLAKKHKPKLIWIGATAYSRKLPFAQLAKIADKVGAYLVADIAHIAGLVVGGVHPSPVKYAHIITSTTHKTLRGPRSGLILVTKKGLKKDPKLATKIDKAIMPGSQGGPHEHQIAALAVALKEASTIKFKKYTEQIIKNSKALATELKKQKIELVSGGTDNHLILIKTGKGKGAILEIALDAIGITANKNTIPQEPASPFFPSGLRIGTPSITTRGMKEKEMKKIANWISQIIKIIALEELPETEKTKDKREYLKKFTLGIKKNKDIKKIKTEVKKLCQKFSAPDKFI